MFKFETELFCSLCDPDYYITPEGMQAMVQECVGLYEHNNHTSVPYTLKENKSWVILSSYLKVIKKPYWNDRLTLCCEAFDDVGVLVPRRVKAYRGDELMFYSDSYFALISIDGGKHKIIAPSCITSRYLKDVNNDFEFAKRFKKFDTSSLKPIIKEKYKVSYKDCDVNSHMNNLRYSSVLFSFLPKEVYDEGKDITSLDILFSKEIFYKDEVDVCIYTDENGVYYGSISDAFYAKFTIDKVLK